MTGSDLAEGEPAASPPDAAREVSVLACVDDSPFAASVCDHAAWLAGALGGGIDLLHVVENPGPERDAAAVLDRACSHLADLGVTSVRTHAPQGSLIDAIGARGEARTIVLGKRGERSPPDRRQLGSNATALLRSERRSLCLVSQFYLPVHRGLVMIDADAARRRSIETVASNAALAALDLDIVMAQPAGADGAAKLAWARETLRGRSIDVYPSCRSAETAAAAYMQAHSTDLIIISREMLFAPERTSAPDLQDHPLWGWRTPVFVA